MDIIGKGRYVSTMDIGVRRSGLVRFAVFVVTVTIIWGAGLTPLQAQDAISATAQIPSPTGETIDPSVSLILFYSATCPHCQNELAWLEEVESEFPDVTIHRFEINVSDNQANLDYFAKVMEAYGSFPVAWPRTVIGDRVYIGFNPSDGPPRYSDEYQAWTGYQNLLYRALQRAQERAVAAR